MWSTSFLIKLRLNGDSWSPRASIAESYLSNRSVVQNNLILCHSSDGTRLAEFISIPIYLCIKFHYSSGTGEHHCNYIHSIANLAFHCVPTGTRRKSFWNAAAVIRVIFTHKATLKTKLLMQFLQIQYSMELLVCSEIKLKCMNILLSPFSNQIPPLFQTLLFQMFRLNWFFHCHRSTQNIP